MGKSRKQDPWEYSLRMYLLLLATLVATVTYTAGFNPPGGVWQDTDEKAGHLAGDTSYFRYIAFVYCNATAYISSLVVIIFVLILSVMHDRGNENPAPLHTLRVVMLLDLLSLMGAYAAGTCRDKVTTIYSLALVICVAVYVAAKLALASWRSKAKNDIELERLRKVLMLLATFSVCVTYVAGMSAQDGFWDNADGSHQPGHAGLKGGHHDGRLKAFFICNTTAFVASLLIVVLLFDKKLQPDDKLRYFELYGFIVLALVGLVGAYSAGSCREIDTTIYVNALIGAVLILVVTVWYLGKKFKSFTNWVKGSRPFCWAKDSEGSKTNSGDDSDEPRRTQALEKARSLVLVLATLAATITYQAGLDPPGGLWQDDGSGYMAGDPILLTRSPKRYKAFYYCNSVAFVASLVAIILVQTNTQHKHNALEAAMIMDLFGLIGAYVAGSCRDVQTSVYVLALAGASLVYVVIHVVCFVLDYEEVENAARKRSVEKRRKRLFLCTCLAATITYQAGLTPPSGFRLQDDVSGLHAGDPVLLYNSARRYKAFLYCNSVSFILSIAIINLLANKNLYRPSIDSNALPICTVVCMCGLVGAYATGITPHFKTSIYIFVVAGVVLLVVALLVVVFLFVQPKEEDEEGNANTTVEEEDEGTTEEVERRDTVEEMDARRKYLMLLAVLLTSVTYKSGLEPQGGFRQSEVGHHNRRQWHFAFFYSNSTSFVSSIVVIVLLLPLRRVRWRIKVINITIMLDLLGILVAYAAGTSRSWKTSTRYDLVLLSVFVSAPVTARLGYIVLLSLSSFRRIYQRLALLSASQTEVERRRWTMDPPVEELARSPPQIPWPAIKQEVERLRAQLALVNK